MPKAMSKYYKIENTGTQTKTTVNTGAKSKANAVRAVAKTGKSTKGGSLKSKASYHK